MFPETLFVTTVNEAKPEKKTLKTNIHIEIFKSEYYVAIKMICLKIGRGQIIV